MTRGRGVVHFVVPAGIDDPEPRERRQRVRPAGDRGLRALGWDVRRCEVDIGSAGRSARCSRRCPTEGWCSSTVWSPGACPGRWEPRASGSASSSSPTWSRRRSRLPTRGRSRASGGRSAPHVSVIVTRPWTRSELVSAGSSRPSDRRGDSRSRRGCAGGGTREAERCCASESSRPQRPGHSDRGPRRAPRAADLDGARSSDRRPPIPPSSSTRGSRRRARGRRRITMTGALADDDLRCRLPGADLLVAPSRAESYGMAIADALRARHPRGRQRRRRNTTHGLARPRRDPGATGAAGAEQGARRAGCSIPHCAAD